MNERKRETCCLEMVVDEAPGSSDKNGRGLDLVIQDYIQDQ